MTLCLIDSELFSYETAVLQSSPPNSYELSMLYRGQYGTVPMAHSIGAPFVRVDDAVFQYFLPAGFVGVTIYVKLQSFNIFGNAVEDLSECQVFTYTLTGAGSPNGAVTQALLIGTEPNPWDWGSVAGVASESNDWGTIISPAVADINYELGLGAP